VGDSHRVHRYTARFREITWYRENVPCWKACPVHTDSGRYVQLIAESKWEEAFLVARSPNPLASVCGRICAAPCEDACRRGWIDEPVTIRPLKRFVTERFGAESSRPDTCLTLIDELTEEDLPCNQQSWNLTALASGSAGISAGGSEQKVAVVGSGPAGLGCAHDLALLGYHVTVFEALADTGGMLRYGIPEYRLPRGVIDREVALIERLGVEFRTHTPLTVDYGLEHLRREGFEAFFLSVGAMRGRDLSLPGSDKDGVVKAVDYLLNLNRGYRVDVGKRVVVIGGGAVAFDAARSAVREIYQPMKEIEMTAEAVAGQPAMDVARGALRSGAAEVHVASLESLEDMPASRTVQGRDELREAVEEGIVLHPSWGPREFIGDNHVTGVGFAAVTRVFDENGRFSPQFDESRKMTLPADTVILAIGQQPDLDFLTPADGVQLTRAGTIQIDPDTLATTAEGVFAGGDAAFGPRIAIEAVANGKQAAQSIRTFLSGKKPAPSLRVRISTLETDDYRMPDEYEKVERRSAPTVEIDRRTGIAEVEHIMEEEEAKRQAERCLSCHIETIYDASRCVLCNRCADVCPEKCLTFVPIEDVEMPSDQREAALAHYGYEQGAPLTVLLKDDTACIRCGLCAIRCPTDAITMERLNFIESADWNQEEGMEDESKRIEA